MRLAAFDADGRPIAVHFQSTHFKLEVAVVVLLRRIANGQLPMLVRNDHFACPVLLGRHPCSDRLGTDLTYYRGSTPLLLIKRYMNTEQAFEYRGCHFLCRAVEINEISFEPHVRYVSGVPGVQPVDLPRDSAAYNTEVEAMRHAEEQAVRWVHDHTGDGQGQF